MLLKDILRGEWRFPGYVVSDCGAIDDIYLRHKVVGDGAASGGARREDAARTSIAADVVPEPRRTR